MDDNTLDLVEDYCNRNGLLMNSFVIGKSIKELISIAEMEYEQQQCDDARTYNAE